MPSFGERLKAARQTAGLTQQHIANLFEPPMSRNAVANWEAGTNMPDSSHLTVIARAVKESVDYLLEGRGKRGNSPDHGTEQYALLKIADELDEDRLDQLVAYARLLQSDMVNAPKPTNLKTSCSKKARA